MKLHEAHRELHKWLNEEQTKPVDREALATVLAATAQELEHREEYWFKHAAAQPVQPAPDRRA